MQFLALDVEPLERITLRVVEVEQSPWNYRIVPTWARGAQFDSVLLSSIKRMKHGACETTYSALKGQFCLTVSFGRGGGESLLGEQVSLALLENRYFPNIGSGGGEVPPLRSSESFEIDVAEAPH